MSHPCRTVYNTDIHVADGITLIRRERELAGIALDMFQGRCTLWRLEQFEDDGQYQDAFASAVGRKQIGGQLFGVPIVTQSVITKAHQVISKYQATDGGVRLRIRMEHRFHFTMLLVGKVVDFSTVLTLDISPAGNIAKLTDRPEEDLPTNPLVQALKDFNTVAAPLFLPTPTNAEEDEQWWKDHVENRQEQLELEREQGGSGGAIAVEESKRG